MTATQDPRKAALEYERRQVPRGTPTAALDAVLACAAHWSAHRLAWECAEVASEIAGATQVALYCTQGSIVRCVGLSPSHLESPLLRDQMESRFPWDIPSLQPSRFVLVQDARELTLPESRRVGELGLVSAVHLPLEDEGHKIGALQLYWNQQVAQWDDRIGAVLRALGVFALTRDHHSGVRATLAPGMPRESL